MTATEAPQEIERSPLANCRRLLLREIDAHVLDAGKGPAVLCIHGMGSSHYGWRRNIDILMGSFRLVAPDLPGYGFSREPEDFAYRIDDYVHFLCNLLDALKVKRVHLLAHSFGAAIAERFARLHPKRVDRLILVGAADMEDPTLYNNEKIAKHLLLNSYFDKSVIDLQLVQLAKIFNQDGRTVATSHRVSRVNRNGVSRGDAPPLSHPTLVIWGREDLIIPLELAERVLPHLEDRVFHIIEDAGHACHEEKPELFNRLVRDFLKSRTGADE